MTPLPSPSSFWGPKGVGCVVSTFTCTIEGPSCSAIWGTGFCVAFSEGAEDVVCSSVLRPAALWSCDELLLVPQLVASAPVRRRIKRETSKTTRRCFSGGDFMAFVSFLIVISVQSFTHYEEEWYEVARTESCSTECQVQELSIEQA